MLAGGQGCRVPEEYPLWLSPPKVGSRSSQSRRAVYRGQIKDGVFLPGLEAQKRISAFQFPGARLEKAFRL